MGSPYLNNDESIILSAHNILVDAVLSEVILTSRRLMLVDSGHVRFQHREIPFAAIATVTTGESGSGDPSLSLAILTKNGATKPLQLVFSQHPRSGRDGERDNWAQKIKEQVALLPPGTPPEMVDLGEESGSAVDISNNGTAPGAAPAAGGDAGSPAAAGPARTASRSPRFPVPAAVASGKKLYITAAAIAIVILVIAGIVLLTVGFLPAQTRVPPPAPTPAPAVDLTKAPVTTTPPATEATPVPASTPDQVPVPQPTAVTTFRLQTSAPVSGVWVQIGYEGEYTGTIGTGGRLREVSGTGGRFYQVPASSSDIVEISIQKKDTAGLPLTVEVFNNGEMIKHRTIITPRGTLVMSVDLKMAQTPVITPAVTQ